jgi:ABC-2 type transport system ATP-binding protein
MIQTVDLTKRFGSHLAVDRLSFRAHHGRITGLLGTAGSGKSTALRMLLGLVHPTSGKALINGKPYAQHQDPLHQVGALMQDAEADNARKVSQHLGALAVSQGVPKTRVEDLISLTGLNGVAGTRIGKLSGSMRRRMGIATALLGDPKTLILDDPASGLDPEGISWLNDLLRYLASRDKTILIASSRITDLKDICDVLLVMDSGRLLAQLETNQLVNATEPHVLVRSPRSGPLAQLLRRNGADVLTNEAGQLDVRGLAAKEVGALASDAGIPLYELTPVMMTFKETFLKMVSAQRHDAATGAEVLR